MATDYLCKRCNIVFTGFDPIRFGSSPQLSFPECPNGSMAQYLATGRLPEGEGDILGLMNRDALAHPVTLAVVEKLPEVTPPQTVAVPPKPTGLTGAWGSGTLVIKEETPEERKARLMEEAKAAQKRHVEKIEAEKATRVGKLLKRIEVMIKGGGGEKTANFPKDLEYGFKKGGNQLSEDSAIITLAGAEWAKLAHRTFRDAAWKKNWEQYQANFEQDIVIGDRSQGKHNVHVVAT
ncbi:hypothetical protein [Rubrimonas cliftonensis]|uniref:Uncharacterized protein n=1 Tax=Rubrimonas cliftonensis TaxID=89524 RepID=A0A1H3VZ54_9RHOB|nr:hypothetical protein [Rubrimonas cliftonensis]SDZ79474.1 hypothetical protein SAMN05444370_101385 [Rubrimonas cliftonensis]